MEVNGHAIDVVAAAVDNVSNNCDKVTSPKTNYFEVLCTVMQISLQEKWNAINSCHLVCGGKGGVGGGVMSLIHIPFTPSPATSLVQV